MKTEYNKASLVLGYYANRMACELEKYSTNINAPLMTNLDRSQTLQDIRYLAYFLKSPLVTTPYIKNKGETYSLFTFLVMMEKIIYMTEYMQSQHLFCTLIEPWFDTIEDLDVIGEETGYFLLTKSELNQYFPKPGSSQNNLASKS